MGENIKKVWLNINHLAFWTCLLTSIFLLVASLFIPPHGVIDSSVVAGVGELIGFGTLAAVFDGIDKAKNVTFQKGDTQISLSRNKKKKEAEHGGEYENEVLGNRDN